jgi:hypothetical protein
MEPESPKPESLKPESQIGLNFWFSGFTVLGGLVAKLFATPF